MILLMFTRHKKKIYIYIIPAFKWTPFTRHGNNHNEGDDKPTRKQPPPRRPQSCSGVISHRQQARRRDGSPVTHRPSEGLPVWRRRLDATGPRSVISGIGEGCWAGACGELGTLPFPILLPYIPLWALQQFSILSSLAHSHLFTFFIYACLHVSQSSFLFYLQRPTVGQRGFTWAA